MAARVLIVDDHQIIRQGLKLLLTQEPELEVVGEAADGAEAIQQTEALKPDVVIMDLNMPVMNGIESTRIIKSRFPGIKVVVLSMFDDQHFIEAMQEAGASGYVLKEAAYEMLVSAIQEVLHDQESFPPREDGGADLNVTMRLSSANAP